MGIIRDLVSGLADSKSAPRGSSPSNYNPSYTVDSRVQQPSQQYASNQSNQSNQFNQSPQFQPSQNDSYSPPPPSYTQQYGVTTSSTSQPQPQQYSKQPAPEFDPQQNDYNTRQVDSSQFSRPQQEPRQYIQPQSQFQPQPQIETRYYVAQQAQQDDNGGRRRGGRLRQRIQDRRGRRNGGGGPLTMVFEEVTRIGEKRFGGGNGDGYGRR